VNVIGFDDGPFARAHRGSVLLVGAVCAGTRLDGVVSGRIRRDGADATRRMIELVRGSQFGGVRAVMLQGIAVGGFNVVDVEELRAGLGIPVLVIMRRPPDMDAIRRALFGGEPRTRVPVRGAARKWRLILRAGAIEALPVTATTGPAGGEGIRPRKSGLRDRPQSLWVQRTGLSMDAARRLVERTTLHGHVPEPLRLAHLIAGGIAAGKSRGRTWGNDPPADSTNHVVIARPARPSAARRRPRAPRTTPPQPHLARREPRRPP